MSQAFLENEMNQQKARYEKDLFEKQAKIEALEKENRELRQKFQVATADDKENVLVQELDEIHVEQATRNLKISKRIADLEGLCRGNQQKSDDKDAQIKELEKKLKQFTYAVEEKDREIRRLNENFGNGGRPVEANVEGIEELKKILEPKLNGQRMECPTCLEADGQAPILRNLWICPDHFLQKYNRSITEMPLDELDKIAREEAFCSNCIQHSHRRCQSDMLNLLELKKQYIGEEMHKFLDGMKWLEKIDQQVPKTSAQSAEERIKKKIDGMIKNDRLRTAEVDEKVENLVVSLTKFADGTAEFAAKMQETMRNMVDIENDADE